VALWPDPPTGEILGFKGSRSRGSKIKKYSIRSFQSENVFFLVLKNSLIINTNRFSLALWNPSPLDPFIKKRGEGGGIGCPAPSRGGEKEGNEKFFAALLSLCQTS
jgi:hypothetical protein